MEGTPFDGLGGFRTVVDQVYGTKVERRQKKVRCSVEDSCRS